MLQVPAGADLSNLWDHLAGLLHAEDRNECLWLSEEATAAVRPFRWEGRLVVGGDIRWMSVETVPRHSSSHGLVWEGVMVDITERKLTETSLASTLDAERKAREMVERDVQRKERFLASVSHEIRTPLSAMVALAHSMLEECARHGLPSEFAHFLEQVRSGGYYLNHILINLLDLNAIEEGRFRVVTEDFYLRDLVEDTANILDPIARAGRIALDWKLPADLDARFRSDPARLSQIILNLGHNALKHGSKEGARVTIEIDLAAEVLTLRVLDEGCGIPGHPGCEATLHATEKHHLAWDFSRGVGLGLAVVRENCRLLGGCMNVRARGVPGGTVFEVSIPPIAPDFPS